jgi:hypothetical protein
MTKRMYKCLLVPVLVASLGASSLGATAEFWINNGTVFTPTAIDAYNVVNNGLISISTTIPFDFSNTRNFTNSGGMENLGSGFRFDTAPSGTGVRKPAAVFFNAGLAGNPTTNAYIRGGNRIDVSATNVINRGYLSAGGLGFVSINGSSVDASRGIIETSSLIQRTEDNPAGIFDRYWGTGTNRVNSAAANIAPAGFPAPATPGLLSGAATNFINGLTPVYFTANMPVYLASAGGGGAWTNFSVSNDTRQTLHLVYVRNPNTNISVEIFRFGGSPAQMGRSMVHFFAKSQTIFGAGSNHLYVVDSFGQNPTNVNFLPHFPDPVAPIQTAQPDNYRITKALNQINLGLGPLITSSLTPAQLTSLLSTVSVTNALYSSYGMQLTPSTVAPLDLNLVRTSPGRIELKATRSLDLSRTRIEAANYTQLHATNHFVSPTNSWVASPYVDMYLASTNGTIDTSGLFRNTLTVFNGTVDLFSLYWTNTIINTNGAGSTNDLQVHVLYVDANLSETAQAKIFDLSMKSTNLIANDSLRVLRTLALDVERLTVTPFGNISIENHGISWPASAPKMAFLTNHGTIQAFSDLYFVGVNSNGTDRAYGALYNTGMLAAAGVSVTATSIWNSGIIIASNGPISLNGQNLVRLEPLGVLRSVNGNVNITTGNLWSSNHSLTIGRSLNLSVTGELRTGINAWTVYDGFSLLSKPASGDLASTTITNRALSFANPFNYWAGLDLGATGAGFSNNAALGKLVLSSDEQNGLFTFVGTGPGSNALYVDVLVLAGGATNRDAGGNLTALDVWPGMKIYFSQAFVVNGPGSQTEITSELAGKNGGALSQVPHTGPLSIPILITISPALKVSVEKEPALRSLVTWETPPSATNSLYYVNNPYSEDWQLLTNFVSGAAGQTVTIADPGLSTSRFYKVRLDKPAN